MLFSVLETLDVYTIFGSDHSVRVYYFRIRKAWKCILFSNLKTLEVQTIIGLKTLEVHMMFGIENHGSVYSYRD